MNFLLAAAAAPASAPAGFQFTPALGMFLAFVLVTLGITYWSARKSTGASNYFAAGRGITAWQNGLAVAGDYMSAASFLGIAGMIAFKGYDGFMYSVGWLVAYLTVLLVVAEPLRNAGKYTMADVLAYRLSPRPVRAMAALSTLTVSTFYMIAQMVGAGALVKLLLPGVGYEWAVTGVVKKFAGVDVFDIEIDENDPVKLVDIIASLEHSEGSLRSSHGAAAGLDATQLGVRFVIQIPA